MGWFREKYQGFLKNNLERVYNRRRIYEVMPRHTFDKFVNFSVGFTNFLFSIGIFFSLYIVFVRLMLPRAGFETTVIVVMLILVLLLRSFLETVKKE